VDYEAELAVVIGKTARKVSEAQALQYVLATLARTTSPPRLPEASRCAVGSAKSFDTFCPLGLAW